MLRNVYIFAVIFWHNDISCIGSFTIVFLRNWILVRLSESIKNEYSKIIFRDKKVWLMKREACLNALKLANSVLSNYQYENAGSIPIERQYMNIDEVRKTMDALIVSCKSGEVVDKLKIIITGPVKPDSIVDLRTAARKELGYSDQIIDHDGNNAFIATINCLYPNKGKK